MEGYTPLDFVGFTDKGEYAEESTYMQNDIVHYLNSVWRCTQDNTSGVTPAENNSWSIFLEGTKNLNGIIAKDVQGLLGTENAENVNAQELINAIADRIANKLLAKTDVVSQVINDTTKAVSAAAVYALQQKIGTGDLPDGMADVVSGISSLYSNLNNIETTKYAISGSVDLSKYSKENPYPAQRDGYVMCQVWGSTSTIKVWFNGITIYVPLTLDKQRSLVVFIKAGMTIGTECAGNELSALLYPIYK